MGGEDRVNMRGRWAGVGGWGRWVGVGVLCGGEKGRAVADDVGRGGDGSLVPGSVVVGSTIVRVIWVNDVYRTYEVGVPVIEVKC